jgi:hypothetical protein
MTILFEGNIFADYFQFYLTDSSVVRSDSTPWTDSDLRRRVRLDDSAIAFRVARNMEVPVRVEFHNVAPNLQCPEADHVVEAPLNTLGEIVIAGCSDYWPDAIRARVPPGQLRVRLLCYGFGTLSQDGRHGSDRYVLLLWQGDRATVIVHRQWQE